MCQGNMLTAQEGKNGIQPPLRSAAVQKVHIGWLKIHKPDYS